MPIDFTDEQKLAIYTRDRDLLVSAAAGSGKTAVLVRRIIELISNEEKPVDIDRLLVVTFTDAAAMEMRQRISSALDALLDTNEGSEHLLRQRALLGSAGISTIHAFCLKVIRKYFHATGLDPSFSVADNTETRLMKTQAMDELLEDAYAKDDNEPFFNLVESYGGKKTSDDALSELIMRVYEFIGSSPWPEQMIREYVERFNGIKTADGTVWSDILKKELETELAYAAANVDLAISVCARPFGPEHYIETLESDRRLIHHFISLLEQPMGVIHDSLEGIKFENLKSKRGGDTDKELIKLVQDIRKNEIKDVMTKLNKELFFKSPELMAADLSMLYPVMNTLAELTLEFGRRYSELKMERNKVDFNDLEHYCLRILLENQNGEIIPTQAAQELSAFYYEILTDEYQDSNAVQESILSAISHGNRFMVGDVKQSIYRFRRAKPQLFTEKYVSYAQPGAPGSDINMKIDLSQNFRSRENVLNCVNYLFMQLMTTSVGEIGYDENAMLRPGAVYPDADGIRVPDTVDLDIIDWKEFSVSNTNESTETDDAVGEISKIAIEAGIIAERILEMTGPDGLSVLDNETKQYRSAAYKDIVILMRTVNDCAVDFIDELKRYGIPAHSAASSGFFDTTEVSTMLSFLRVVDNPRQDRHLITVLHCPVYALSADELLEIRQAGRKNENFYDCAIKYISTTETETPANQKLEAFLHDLGKWRALSAYSAISRLIAVIYDDTNYFNYAGIMSGGPQRQANLRVLKEQAERYETTSYRGLFNFITYVEKIKKSDADAGEAHIQDMENSVRIMTIHKSKGLEFPIVFLARLGKQFNLSDERESIVLHETLGFGPKYVNPEKRKSTDTLARHAVIKKLRRENFSEELRVLYVALTRAKEKLILTGCIGNLKSKMAKNSRFVPYVPTELPDGYLLDCNTFMDWILACVIRHQDAGEIRDRYGIDDSCANSLLYRYPASFNIKLHNSMSAAQPDIPDIFADEINKESEQTSLRTGNPIARLCELDTTADYSGEKQDIHRKLSWIYSFEYAKALPSKVSISEIKRSYYREMLKDSAELQSIYGKPLFNEPDFLKKETGLSPAGRGTAIHTVMEHLELTVHNSEQSIIALIKELTAKNILSPEEAAAVPVDRIADFTRSPVAQRILRSPFVKKETPFIIGLTPAEVYRMTGGEAVETILVHGIIDCFFEEDGQMVLVDYKSDYATEESIESIKERYRIQLDVYKAAVERSTGKPVSERILYLFSLGMAVTMDRH